MREDAALDGLHLGPAWPVALRHAPAAWPPDAPRGRASNGPGQHGQREEPDEPDAGRWFRSQSLGGGLEPGITSLQVCLT